ncbi:Pycsar system effector family protein [Streptomyces sp. NPDC050161]|uniref:Pycsar system effector family protein n=1 Tax=Streptomyces sp. NPDC050161 TaxID=3365604 RepID=UPI0037A24B91
MTEVSADRLRALGTGAFAELQRADAKAATLGATAGAGLGADFTMVTAFAKTMPLWGMVGAGCASACFALSILQCLSAMRPSLRPGDRRRPDCYLDCAEATADELLAAVVRLSAWEVARAESRCVTELSTLAQAKFKMLRRATLLSQLALAATCLSAVCVLLSSLTGT